MCVCVCACVCLLVPQEDTGWIIHILVGNGHDDLSSNSVGTNEKRINSSIFPPAVVE